MTRRREKALGCVHAAVVITSVLFVVAQPVGAQGNAELSVVRRIWTVGVESGPPEQEFGKIVDAAFGPDGSVYLLDASSRVIRVFDANGRFVRTFGRSGRGPGELMTPESLYHDGKETLYVLDNANGMLVFRTTPSEARYVRNIPLPFVSAADFCFVGASMYVLAIRADSTLIHEVSADGRVVRSFGTLFGARELPLAVRQVLSARGRVSCHAKHQTVVVIARDLSDVRGYRTTDGRLAWSDSLRGFRSPTLEVVNMGGSPGVKRSIPVGGSDANVMLRPLNDDVVLAQSNRVHRDRDVIATRALDVRTGARLVATDAIKRVPVVQGARAIMFDERPYSTVSLVEVRYVAGRDR